MVFGLIVSALGATLVVWPSPFVSWVRLYRSGSVLSINAPVNHTPPVERTQVVGRIVGLVLLIGGVALSVWV